MITRIVKMTFREDAVEDFLEIYDEVNLNIADFEGCQLLELMRDTENTNVLMTISLWESEEHLDTYRKSQLFNKTWARTKVLFAEPAEAFSMRKIG